MNVMRCTQPFIPISGKLEKQILGLRSFGIGNSDFCKHIDSKYTGLKLRRLNFPDLTLLKRLSSNWNVINTIQVLKNQIISAPPFTANLSLYLNLLFWNKAVPEFVAVESKFQPYKSLLKVLAVAQNTSILITKTLLTQFTQPLNIELRQQERSLYQSVLPFQSKSTPVARRLSLQQQRAIEITPSKPQPANVTLQTQNQQLDKPGSNLILKSSLYQPVVPSQSKTAAVERRLSLQQQRAIEITPFTPQPTSVIPQTQNQELGKPDSNLQTIKSQPNYPTLVNRTQKFVLINSTNISRITSTSEQTSLLIQRLQSVETQSLIQHKKAVTHSLDDLRLAPHHIRTRELKKTDLSKLSPSFETEGFVFQQQLKNVAGNKQPNYRSSLDSSTTAMEFVQPKASFPAISTNQENMVGMKKDLTKRRQGDLNMPTVDVNRLADQVYQVIERKIKIERQRRGMF